MFSFDLRRRLNMRPWGSERKLWSVKKILALHHGEEAEDEAEYESI